MTAEDQKRIELMRAQGIIPGKYIIKKADGRPIDPGSEYFVLRLDVGGADTEHIKACRAAIVAYADAIEHHLPKLAAELRAKYGVRK
jgi:hypothetical protein